MIHLGEIILERGFHDSEVLHADLGIGELPLFHLAFDYPLHEGVEGLGTIVLERAGRSLYAVAEHKYGLLTGDGLDARISELPYFGRGTAGLEETVVEELHDGGSVVRKNESTDDGREAMLLRKLVPVA